MVAEVGVKERIKVFLSFLGIGQNKFEEIVGLSNGYINNVKSIGTDKLIKIIKEYPQLSIEWILTGEGEMLKNKSISVDNNGSNNTNIINSPNSNNRQYTETDIELLKKDNEYKQEVIEQLKKNIELLEKLLVLKNN